jgi:hypothetical protein
MNAIEEHGKEREAKETARLDLMEKELPNAIGKLPSMNNDILLDALLAFSGSVWSVRENDLRAKYAKACREEILKRMTY